MCVSAYTCMEVSKTGTTARLQQPFVSDQRALADASFYNAGGGQGRSDANTTVVHDPINRALNSRASTTKS